MARNGFPSPKMVAAFYFFGLLLAPVWAEPVLKQVHVITRTGSRMPVKRHSRTSEEESRETPLTLLGQQQMYDLGVWLRDRYSETGFDKSSFVHYYQLERVHLESSALERTILSSNSLSWGMFDQSARSPANASLMAAMRSSIPVFTTKQENDISIRAFDKCDSHHRFLDALYNSLDWHKLEKDNNAFLRVIGNITEFKAYTDDTGKVPLRELWNVFDMIHVAKTECAGGADTQACQEVPDASVRDALTTGQWNHLKPVVRTAELMKHGSDTAGRLIGGNLLLKIANRMAEDDGLFYHYSAHYPTILGVFTALGEEFVYSDAIPNYASALIIELYKESVSANEMSVEIWYKAGVDSKDAVLISRTVKDCGKDSNCHMDMLSTSLSGFSSEGWCRECGNSDADVCLAMQMKKLNQTQAQTPQMESASCPTKLDRPVVVGLFAGIGLGMIIMAFALWWNAHAQNRQIDQNRQMDDQVNKIQHKLQGSTDDGGTAGNNTESEESSVGIRDLI